MGSRSNNLEARYLIVVDVDGWRVAHPAVKALFGRPLRILLAAWVLGRHGEPFFLQEVQRALSDVGEATSGVAKEVRVFVEHGLLAETRDGRRTYFTPLPSPYWRAFQAIAESCGLLRDGPDATVEVTGARAP